MTHTTQTEAQRLADALETAPIDVYVDKPQKAEITSRTLDAAASELRRLDAAEQTHMRELRAYRLTVENFERRIAELEASGAAAPVLYGIADGYGDWYCEEGSVAAEAKDLQHAADSLNSDLDDDEPPYKVVPLYTHPNPHVLDAARIGILTAIEDSGEGLRYGLECLVNNGVNTFIVYDEQREEYLGDGWLTDPLLAIDEALAAQAKQGEQANG